MYPRLEIDVKKIRENAAFLAEKFKKSNISTAVVTKSFCAHNEVVKSFEGSGIDYIADSRVENLKRSQNVNIEKILIRIPMISECEEIVKYADISFNSEIKTIRELNRFAKESGKTHKIVLMVDLGDLREGYFNEEELMAVADEIVKMDNIELMGIATNLTCYGAVIPKYDNLSRLSDIAQKLRVLYGIELPFVSGGNSSSIYLLDRDEMPEGITNLRPGEAVVLGRETAYGADIDGMHQDAFKLVCEVVEIKEKPSIPIGEIGVDAFGNKPVYEDKGVRRRAIVAIGKQDIDIGGLMPVDSDVEILGASSDHMIIDITDSKESYDIGDKLEFMLEYGALMMASTSEYVKKVTI